jgi:2-polyprenyl-3-methyl-5-hydroxy-6-metoxy-1,4-benzoquinol methylase
MSDRELKASLDFMGIVNRFFGGTRAVVRFFERAAPPERFTALDIGCGGGDIPAAVARWAKKTNREASITAIDLNERCLRYAARKNASPGVRYLAHSAFDIASLGSFDYIFSSMFFHHLSDVEIASLLSAMRRQSRLGYLVNDLSRSPTAHLGATALSALAFDKTVYHDARLSVRRAFTPADFERYRAAAAPESRVERRALFRIVLYHA